MTLYRRRVPLVLLVIPVVVLVVCGFVGFGGGGVARAAGLSDPSVLTVHEGGMTVTTNGAVVENLEIRGRLVIEASNVTVRNVWVYASASAWTVQVKSGSARFENVEIGHPSHKGVAGIGGNNITAVGLDIHHVEDGIKLGSSSVYSGIRVHDLASPNASPHSDAVQVESGSKNSTVKNSTLSSVGSGIGNSAVIVKSDFGQPNGITFANNYMNGGNYTVFVRDGGHGFPQNVTFTGNRFGGTNRYGIASIQGPVTWQDNTLADTGEVIDQNGDVIGGGSGGSPTTTTKPPATPTTTKPPAATTTTAPTTTTQPAAEAGDTTSTPPPQEDSTTTTSDTQALPAVDDGSDGTNFRRVVAASALGLAVLLAAITVGRIVVDRRDRLDG